MSKRKKKKTPPVTEPTRYSKEDFLLSENFARFKGILRIILSDNHYYTVDEVNDKIDNYMKGKVK